MSRRLIGLALAAGIASASCGVPGPIDESATDAADSGPDVPGGPTVSVGTGQSDWLDLPPTGGNVELIYGAQGGYHIWGRARFRGLQPDIQVSFQVTRVDDGSVTHMPSPARRWIEMGVRRGLVDLGGGEYATDAELVIESIRCSNELVGRQIRFQVFVRENATGRTLTDERIVTVVDNDNPVMCAMPTG